MIKQYNVTVNGQVYEVSVETVYGSRAAAPAASRPAAPVYVPEVKAPPVAPVQAKAAAAPAAEGETVVSAPMPGNMWKVKTAAGQAVKKGDVLFILEAMKMENEIFAPCDGTVANVPVVEGAAVNTGDVLCVIK